MHSSQQYAKLLLFIKLGSYKGRNRLIPHEVIASVAGTVQPLVFETGYEDVPYSIHGTVFLVGFEGRAFIITARHNLSLSGGPANPLCIFRKPRLMD